MNESLDDFTHDRLSAILREAREDRALPPGFQNAVWRRIERQRKRWDFRECLGTFGSFFLSRRSLAGMACAMVVGAALGAREAALNLREDAQSRYVAMVDPFQSKR